LIFAGCGDGDTSHGRGSSAAGARQSSNWSGYVKVGLPGAYNHVKATWAVPAVQCVGDDTTASSTWTGVGGGTPADPTLVQAGTEQDCNGGAEYSAWWEVLPAPAVGASGDTLGFDEFAVGPGDQMTVTIDGSTAAIWAITIRNDTRGWTFNTTVPYSAAGETAEWVQEAPLAFGTGDTGQTTLANFGQVSFWSIQANGANPQLVPDDRVAMVDGSGDVVANPSNPGPAGDEFDICYGPEVCP
jgi:hypothetical protein